MKTIIRLTVLLLILSSCTEEGGTATMRIMLSTSSEKTIAPDETLTTITKYSVEGTGPGGKTFTVDSTSSSLILEDLPTGRWTLDAKGYSSKGKELSAGSVSVDFTPDTGPISIELDKTDGNGSLQLRFEWEQNLNNCSIVVSLTDRKGNALINNRTVRTSSALSYTTWTVPLQLSRGSYLLTAVLYSGEYRVTGIAEAVIINPGERSNANILFTKDSGIDSSLKRQNGFLSLKITNIGETLAANRDYTITAESETHTDRPDLEVLWFLDGETVSAPQPYSPVENSVTVNVPTGIHIISAVVHDRQTGEYTSASAKFRAVAEGSNGLAVFSTNIKASPEGSLRLGEGQMIAPAGGNRFITTTPGSGILQLFEIREGMINILHTLRSTDSGWEWIGDINGIWGNQDVPYVITADARTAFSILRINEENRMEYALWGATPLRMEKYTEAPWLQLIDVDLCAVCSAPDENQGYICVSAQGFGRAGTYCLDSTGIKLIGGYDKPDNLKSLALLEKSTNLIISAGENSKTLWYAPTDEVSLRASWRTVETSLTSAIRIAKFLTQSMILVSDGNSIFFSVFRSKSWLDNKTLALPSIDIQVLPSGPNFYVLENPRTVSSYLANGTVIVRLGEQKLSFDASYLVAGSQYLLAVSPQGEFAILEVINN